MISEEVVLEEGRFQIYKPLKKKWWQFWKKKPVFGIGYYIRIGNVVHISARAINPTKDFSEVAKDCINAATNMLEESNPDKIVAENCCLALRAEGDNALYSGCIRMETKNENNL